MNNEKLFDKLIEEGTLLGSGKNGEQWHISFKEEVKLSARKNSLPALNLKDELIVRALRSGLSNSSLARDMNCTTHYYMGPNVLEKKIRHGKWREVECSFPIVKLIFSHTEKSYEERNEYIYKKDRSSMAAASLQEAMVVFAEPGKAVYRVTSNAKEIGAYTVTRNSGKPKEFALRDATRGGIFYSQYIAGGTRGREKKDLVCIIIPPDFNGLYNPIFEDPEGEKRYLHVWDDEGYSRMLQFWVQQRVK